MHPVIQNIANNSFCGATFPSKFKLTLVKPLLKRNDLIKEEIQSYRLVSNLALMAYFLESWQHNTHGCLLG